MHLGVFVRVYRYNLEPVMEIVSLSYVAATGDSTILIQWK